MVVHSEYLVQNEFQVTLFVYKLEFGTFWDIFVTFNILQNKIYSTLEVLFSRFLVITKWKTCKYCSNLLQQLVNGSKNDIL